MVKGRRINGDNNAVVVGLLSLRMRAGRPDAYPAGPVYRSCYNSGSDSTVETGHNAVVMV